MRLPGFTADAALARSSGTYRSMFAPIAVSGACGGWVTNVTAAPDDDDGSVGFDARPTE
jgi:hypothetical protein